MLMAYRWQKNITNVRMLQLVGRSNRLQYSGEHLSFDTSLSLESKV